MRCQEELVTYLTGSAHYGETLEVLGVLGGLGKHLG